MAQGKARKDAPDDWMSLSDAAEELGEARLTVLTRGLRGEIDAQHIAGRTIVSRESVERVKHHKQTVAAK